MTVSASDASRGLLTLFMVEMWERFAFYGMRALLVLFLVAPAAQGGLALPDSSAAAIYGLYTAMASLMGVVGGWAADRGLGARRFQDDEVGAVAVHVERRG